MRIWFLLIFLFFSCNLFSQNPNSKKKKYQDFSSEYQFTQKIRGTSNYRAKKQKKWGVISDKEDILIQFYFDELISISKYLIAKRNKKFGVMDLQGNTTIPFEYQQILYFYNGHFIAKKNNKWGFLNVENEWDIQPEYDIIEPVSMYNIIDNPLGRNLPISYRNDIGTIGSFISGDYIHISSQNIFVISKNGEYSLMNKNGRVILPYGNHPLWVGFSFKTDTLMVSGGEKNCGIVDLKGKVWIDFEYDHIDFYTWEIFLVKKEGKYGLIHKNGQTIQPLEYQNIRGQLFKKDGKWGIFTNDRKDILLSPIYDEIRIEDNKFKFSVRIGNKWNQVLYSDLEKK